ncbi:hypothetical protein MESS4_260002 [Mesorhizobium sp. STM 4661]|nr:hypothetical protein MESS4_260002 [Mesorhizobium sp. STM 4661]
MIVRRYQNLNGGNALDNQQPAGFGSLGFPDASRAVLLLRLASAPRSSGISARSSSAQSPRTELAPRADDSINPNRCVFKSLRSIDRYQLVRLESGVLRGPDVALAIEPIAQIHAGGSMIVDRHVRATGLQFDDISGLETVRHDVPPWSSKQNVER